MCVCVGEEWGAHPTVLRASGYAFWNQTSLALETTCNVRDCKHHLPIVLSLWPLEGFFVSVFGPHMMVLISDSSFSPGKAQRGVKD